MLFETSHYDYNIGITEDIELQDAIDSGLDVVSIIKKAMEMDEENDSERLLELYMSADEEGRAVLDSMLICICGYTMSSIIEQEM